MSCSIVVRTYNEEKHIGRLLAGVLRQRVAPAEIVVVDSGSTDATLAIATRFPVRVVQIEPDEFTFGRSLNLGLAATTAPVAVLASAHVYPEFDDWLGQLTAPFADRRVALVYGRQRGDSSSRFSERQLFRQWFPERSNPSQDHPFCNNANAAIRLSVWRELPYDETLAGLEDLAWARRILERDHRLVYSAEAVIVHVHEETPARIFRRYQREAMAMRRIFPETRFHLGDLLRLWTANVAQDLRQARLERTVRRHLGGILAFRFLQFWGTYRGFATRSDLSPVLKSRFYYPPGAASERPQAERTGARRIDYAGLDKRNGPG